MVVNEMIPRAQPESDHEICLRCHNSLATSESLIYNFTTDRLGYAFIT